MLSGVRTERSRRALVVALAGSSLVASAALGSVFLTTASDAWLAVAAAGPAEPADGILLLTGLGGAFLSLWLGLGLALSVLGALPGALGQLCRLLADRVAPAVIRKAVALVLGTTLTAALVPGTAIAAIAGMGHRAPGPSPVATATHPVSALALAAPDASFRSVLDPPENGKGWDAAPRPVWLPERPASPQLPGSPQGPGSPEGSRSSGGTGSSPSSSRPAPADSESLVVHRGDALWSIAARQLGPSARAVDIDAEWRRWFAANADVIGDDANLLLPGQVLRRPPPSASAGS